MSRFTVCETIAHGDYRSIRRAPFVSLDAFRAFIAESPYMSARMSNKTDAHGLPIDRAPIDQVAENGYHALSIGRTYSHGWITWEIER